MELRMTEITTPRAAMLEAARIAEAQEEYAREKMKTGELSRDSGNRIRTTALKIAAAIRAAAEALSETPQVGELEAYLTRQWAWSKDTFGPALRTRGIIQHITKELREIEADPHDLMEWVDVVILAMDGFWRHGGKPEDLLAIMQAKNLARQWPDWRTLSEHQAIEHDRSAEALPETSAPSNPYPKDSAAYQDREAMIKQVAHLVAWMADEDRVMTQIALTGTEEG
jgi:hypothetical protein